MTAMQALDKKLIRDFKRLWVQALAIAMVLACGVAILLTAFGMYRALEETRSAYYERNRFADVFASARRAPLSLIREIAAIEGVLVVEPRVSGSAILDLPNRTESAVGKILSYPDDRTPDLNVPLLRSGRFPTPEAVNEVVINEPFALANSYVVGDHFSANLNGQKRVLTITGTALSPEFIYTIGPGAMMPDNETFGIIWMSERAAAAAFDMTGAFNDLSLKLASGTRTEPVIDRLDVLLSPYGGYGAIDRDDQQSDAFLDAEISQLKNMASILPPIFFAISAFLVSMVMGRIIALERSEIGLLKAIGYSNLEVCLHYLMLAGLVALVGIGVGWIAGTALARSLAWQYARFFDFPFLIYRVSYWVYALAGLAALATTTIGAAQSALKAAWLAPATAMQPPAPPRFKRSIIDEAMSALRLSQPVIMIFRSFFRWPVRSALTSLGMAFAVACVMVASFFGDVLDEILDTGFYQTNRQDAMLLFAEDLPEDVLVEVAKLPGVLQVEGQQFHSAELRKGSLHKRVAIEARRPDPDLSRIVGDAGETLNAPPGGLMLSERLAEQLGAAAGDKIEVEFLSGNRETYELTVSSTVEQFFGLGAYMDFEYLNALFRQDPQISTANVSLDTSKLDELHTALKDIPKLTGLIMLTDMRQSFQDTIRENIVVMNTIYLVIAILITIGVAYNGARIQLSERARELASLRILGFSKGEVSFILIGETMLLAILAQPIGWLIGSWIAQLMTESFSSDLYSMPLVLKPATYTWSSLVVLTAAFVSVMIVRRRLDNLNLVSVMKTRE